MPYHAVNLSPLALLATLCMSSLAAAAAIDSVAPNTVYYGKGGSVTITLGDNSAAARLTVAPGGPMLRATLNLPAPAQGIAAGDGVAVIAAGAAGVLVMDLADAQITGSYHDKGDFRHVALRGERVLAVDNQGRLVLLDIHDPKQPRLLNALTLPSNVSALSWHGARACLLLEDGTLRIVAVSDAEAPRVIASQQVHGPAHALADDGRQVFIAGGERGLLIFDGDQGKPIGSYRTTGPALDVALVQGLAFIAQGDKGVMVLDVSTPAAPTWIGSHGKLGDVQRIVAENDRALLFNRQGQVTLLDIGRPDMPTTWAIYPARTSVQAIVLLGREALVAAGRDLQRLDFSAQPPQISNEGLDVGRGVNFGGERRAYIDGNVAYVADWFSGIHLYDISHPDHPRLFSSLHTPGSSKGITVRDGIAYVADDDHGLQVVDVHDPLQPRMIANLPTPGLAYIPKLVGDTLYLAGHRGGFQIIDVKDAAKPRLITSVETPGMAWGIAVDGGVAYVADDQAGLLLIDVKDADHARLLGEFNPGGRAEDVVVRDGIAYLSFFDQGLYVLDVRDPAAPKEMAHLITPGNARGIALQDDFLYLADWLAGVEVIDIREPTRPRLIGSYDTPGAAWGVNVQGDYVYVSDWWGGFMTLNVKDPQRPQFAGRYHERGRVEQVAAKDHFLFTANGNGGMQVFDISNPLNPTWVTGVDTGHAAQRILLNGDSVFLGQDNGAVSIIDIKDPYQSYEIGELDLPAPAVSMAARGDTAYFAVPTLGIVIADVGAPRWPKEVARYITPVTDLCLKGDTLYALTPSMTLLRLDVNEPRHPILRSQEVLSDDSALLRTLGDALVIYQPNRGLMVFRDSNNGLQPIAGYPFKGAVTDMTVSEDKLYATVENDGVYIFTLDNHDLRVVGHYAVTSRPTRTIAHKGTLYIAGESAITALTPLADLTIQQGNGNQVIVNLPPYTPLGSYNLAITDADGNVNVSANALQVAMPRFSRPKITPEEFARLSEQYRKSQGQVPPAR